MNHIGTSTEKIVEQKTIGRVKFIRERKGKSLRQELQRINKKGRNSGDSESLSP